MKKFPIYAGRRGKGKINHVYVNENGERCIEKGVPFKGVIYEYTNKDSEWTDVNGIPVQPRTVDAISTFVKDHENIYNYNYCGDINETYQFLAKEYPDDIDYDVNKMPIMFFDVEVESKMGFPRPEVAENEVVSIACYTTHDKKTTVFGFKDLPSNPDYVKCNGEQDLLEKFWGMLGVDVCMMVGWNSAGFDIPYLINRSRNLGLEVEKYMPLGQIRESFNKDENQTEYNIPGLVLYDYMNLYKKFKLEKLEKYGLDFVCQYEMGKGKVSYTVDHNSLQHLYEKDFEKFIEYNTKDVMLIVDLDKKMNFINLGLQLAYIAKTNPQDISSSMKLWDAIIYNKLLSQKIAVPRKIKNDQERYEGAYVADPDAGLWEWVVSLDYGSLYPNIMISWNMSPQSIVDYEVLPEEIKELRKTLKVSERNPVGAVQQIINGDVDLTPLKKHKLSMSARGDFFDISKQDMVCKVLQDTYQQRVDTKSQSLLLKLQLKGKNDKTNELDNIVQALKILMNSYYGLCGNRFFRYYNRDVAESVTITGQMLIKNQMKMLDELFEKKTGQKCVKYGDTDSIGGDSIIKTNKGNFKIKELFKKSINQLEYKLGKFKGELPDFNVDSFNRKTKKIENKPVKNIMKHKVKKRMFKIKYEGKELIMTEDHSIIINRDGNILDISPKDIKKGDKLIINN